jgi:multidrug efflux pump subunit AcrB
MNISNFCIKHKVTTLLAVILVAIFGVVYTGQLEMALMPNMEMPMAVVYSYYNGASPSDMEELVTRPLESAIMSVSGVDEISSTSSDGLSQLQITYVDGTNLDIAATKLREKFDALTLPDGCSKPVIMNMNISEMMPTAMIGLVGDDLGELQNLADDVVVPALERIDGVADVTLSGGVDTQIAVEVDSSRAAGYGLSNDYISNILKAENLLYPAGDLHAGTQTMTVSTDAKLQTVDDVANVILPLPAGGTVRLGEVANVTLEHPDPDTTAKLNGTNGLLMQISKQSGANERATAHAVVEAMEKLAAENPSIVYACPYLASDYIDMSVESAVQNIIMGVALAAIVVFLFLRKWGATMTIVVSMPVCILSVMVLMDVFGLTLNMMSLGGIAMGVGMIVDNSIVVLENITRFRADGYGRLEACVEGTREVTASLIASTLTTVAVFLPLGLADGMAGMIFKDFCLTIAFLILASLIIAVTLVPLLCYFLLDETKARRKKMTDAAEAAKPSRIAGWTGKLSAWYMKTLDFLIHHLKTGMAITVALVVVFAVSLVSTNMVLMPDMDQGEVDISVSMPIGTQVEQTTALTDRLAGIINENCPEVDKVYYMCEDEAASVMIMLVDRADRSRSSMDIADDLRERLADVAGCELTVTSASMSMGGDSGNDISVEIEGDDYDTLAMIADDLADQISKLPDAIDVKSSLSETVPQVQVSMLRESASQYGLTAATVGAAVRSELTGSTATTVTIDNQELDVVVRGNGISAKSLDALRSMPVTTPRGGTVPLASVASVDVVQAPQTITRDNQTRQIKVTGDTISGDTTAMTQEITKILDNYTLPEGYSATSGGSYADMMENFGDLGLALLVALGLVYFVLASQFESFAMPVIVMMILPVAFTGALFALPVTGRDISMISFVSLIMLAGTVVNASIILVDYIDTRRGMGEAREEAILHACPLRVRPVMMTTLTTILAMVPMAAGWGDTNEMMADMGITMIFGMTISTVITLLFTPVFYSVIDNITHHRKNKDKKKKLSRREKRLEAAAAAELAVHDGESANGETAKPEAETAAAGGQKEEQ